VAGGWWLVEERPSPLVPSHQPPFSLFQGVASDLNDSSGNSFQFSVFSSVKLLPRCKREVSAKLASKVASRGGLFNIPNMA
jgi:hypothetical protein